MAKNKHKKKHHPGNRHRNAGPRAPRAQTQDDKNRETNTQRLGYTAGGAAATSVVGGLLMKQGWAPKTVATGLTLLGAGLGWKGDSAAVRSVGVGTMSAAGAQLALMLWDDHDKKADPPATTTPATASQVSGGAKKQLSNGDGGDLPSGALESAFNRARLAMAVGG
ncbi:MAG: hypothetical protein JNL83_17910 [Myxococcales bacterium]|nr:hypothetical protein [Myxococcales bacterium]